MQPKWLISNAARIEAACSKKDHWPLRLRYSKPAYRRSFEYRNHTGPDHENDDDHGLGSLHNALHDLQNIALPAGAARPANLLSATRRSMPVADVHKGLSLSPPVPPPLT